MGVYWNLFICGCRGRQSFVVTNRCEVVCLDINGFANGNDGPFKDEASYIRPKGMPDELNVKIDADIYGCMICEMN